jgi:hypothetical protein
MHFGTKSYLKSTRNHTAKHALIKFSWMTKINKSQCPDNCEFGALGYTMF